MRLVRDLGRRKLRSTLTITGIAIGIMALVVFGSMANKMNALINGGSKYYADKDIVSIGSMFSGNFQPLSLTDVAKIEKVDGVAVATPGIAMLFDDNTTATMGTPEMISGFVPGGDKSSRPSRSASPRPGTDRVRLGQRDGPGVRSRPQAQCQRRRHGHSSGRPVHRGRHPGATLTAPTRTPRFRSTPLSSCSSRPSRP